MLRFLKASPICRELQLCSDATPSGNGLELAFEWRCVEATAMGLKRASVEDLRLALERIDIYIINESPDRMGNPHHILLCPLAKEPKL